VAMTQAGEDPCTRQAVTSHACHWKSPGQWVGRTYVPKNVCGGMHAWADGIFSGNELPGEFFPPWP
jgi:hypothetical protein